MSSLAFPNPEQTLPADITGRDRQLYDDGFGRGLPFLVAHVDRLMPRGERCLNASCGVGHLAIALSQRFQHVDAVDQKPTRVEIGRRVAARMGVNNVVFQCTPADSLPLAAAIFDAVVCDCLLSPPDPARPLAEFLRVLRPGGRVYLCLGADCWARYLLTERSKKKPDADDAARAALYRTAWRRAARTGLIDRLSSKFAGSHQHASVVRRVGGKIAARLVPPLAVLRTIDAGRQLLEQVIAACGSGYRSLLAADVRRAMKGEDVLAGLGQDQVFQPDEFRELISAAGFEDFQWAVEGSLIVNAMPVVAPPRYPGYFEGQVAVWECICTKPEPIAPAADAPRHLLAAQQASRSPIALTPTSRPIVSNRSESAFPASLLDYASRQARLFGGDDYVRRLGRQLVDGINSEQEAAVRLIRFVQSALFRDPVAQPVLADGALPDPATILFCARGRCGHCAALLVRLCKLAGLDARVHQLPRHVTTEIRVDGRWVVADPDAFKLGVIPITHDGRLPTRDDLEADPYLLDRFPATGWFIRPRSRYTRAASGFQVHGYVDALEPDQRGFVSGYYLPKAIGYPPTLPAELTLSAGGGRFRLAWRPSTVHEGRLLGYHVAVSSKSRGWSYEDINELAAHQPPTEVLNLETAETFAEGALPLAAMRLYASVTALSDRIDLEPATCFQPSEEASCQVAE